MDHHASYGQYCPLSRALDVLGELIERVPPAQLIEHYEATRAR